MKEIIIKNLKIFAYHGVHQEEKINGQNFYIDAVCKVIGNSEIDNIENTVSYSEIIKNIKRSMLSQSFDLIETAADYTCKKLIENFNEISEIELTLKKPEAPIKEDFEYVAVKIIKKRKDFLN